MPTSVLIANYVLDMLDVLVLEHNAMLYSRKRELQNMTKNVNISVLDKIADTFNR